MSKLQEWKLAQKIDASEKRGLIIGLSIAALIILIVIGAIIKIYLLKKYFGCMHCDMDDIGDDLVEEDDIDENGCCYTSDKDFV